MNSEQIKAVITEHADIAKRSAMTRAEEESTAALWEIALQLAKIREAIPEVKK